MLNQLLNLRQRVRDELHKLDAEYPMVKIGIAGVPHSNSDQKATPKPENTLKTETKQTTPNIPKPSPINDINQKKTVIIDTNNVALCNIPLSPESQYRTPKYEQIILAEKYYKNQGFEVRLIADSGLWKYIDNKVEFRKRDERCEIIKSPAGIPADVYILTLASENYPNSIIVTNDTYRQHLELKEKVLLNGGNFQRYTIENGKFIPLSF